MFGASATHAGKRARSVSRCASCHDHFIVMNIRLLFALCMLLGAFAQPASVAAAASTLKSEQTAQQKAKVEGERADVEKRLSDLQKKP